MEERLNKKSYKSLEKKIKYEHFKIYFIAILTATVLTHSTEWIHEYIHS